MAASCVSSNWPNPAIKTDRDPAYDVVFHDFPTFTCPAPRRSQQLVLFSLGHFHALGDIRY